MSPSGRTRVARREWRALYDGWQAMGASHLTFRTMQAEFADAAGHLAAAGDFMRAIGRG